MPAQRSSRSRGHTMDIPCSAISRVSVAHYRVHPKPSRYLYATYATAISPKGIPAAHIISTDTKVFHSGISYLRLTSKWPSLRTIRQPGVPRNLSTSRGWLVYVTSGMIYRMAFMLNFKSPWRITRPSLAQSGYLLPTYATGWPNRIYLKTGTYIISMGTNFNFNLALICWHSFVSALLLPNRAK